MRDCENTVSSCGLPFYSKRQADNLGGDRVVRAGTSQQPEAISHWMIRPSLFSLDANWCRGNIDNGLSILTP